MLGEGETAPEFEVPAVVDGTQTRVALSDHAGEIAVLAFFPGAFSPAGEGRGTGLDDLDLFTMQKDVTVLGISADSVHAHRALAEEHDLSVPLLSDLTGAVAADYGVCGEAEGSLVGRAVVVVGPEGEVQYTWRAEDPRRLPDIRSIRGAVSGIGGGATAEARYRVGHAHYVEGRRAFTSATGGLQESEWMMAQNDFARAGREFDEAADQFDTAARFAERADLRGHYESAEEKAGALSQAAEWLARAASAYASGEGAEADQLRRDAEAPLEEARAIDDPVQPDEFPPETEPEPEPDTPDPEDARVDAAVAGAETRRESQPTQADDVGKTAGDDRIDDDELAEITAEVQEQTEETGDTDRDAAADRDARDIEGEIDLDLQDPDGNGDADEDDPTADGDR